MTKPNRRFAVLALAAAGVVLLSACTTSPTGRSQMILRSDDALAAEAAQKFAEMRASIPLETDRATIDYVHCVATAIVEVLEPQYRDLDWDMAIFDHDAVNAFAMPGGKIGVSRSPVAGVGIQVMAVLLGGGNSGATYTAYEALNQGAALGIMLPFGREQESEADIIGLEFMARAGFDPRQSVPLWQNMAKVAGGNEPAEFLSTHPSNEKRIDSLVSQFGKTLSLYNEAQQEGRKPACVAPPPKATKTNK